MKKWLSIVILVLIIVTSITILAGCGESSGDKPASSESSSEKLTLAKFEKIENGMTYEEVAAIIGSEGEILAETGEKGSDLYTVVYQYYGSGSTGANANFTFQGNPPVLQMKAQVGLK